TRRRLASASRCECGPAPGTSGSGVGGGPLHLLEADALVEYVMRLFLATLFLVRPNLAPHRPSELIVERARRAMVGAQPLKVTLGLGHLLGVHGRSGPVGPSEHFWEPSWRLEHRAQLVPQCLALEPLDLAVLLTAVLA